MHKGDRTLLGFFLVTATLAGAVTTASIAGSLPFTEVKVKPPLTSDDEKKSVNISGISCMPPDDGRRVCLVIDDEGKLAQTATLVGDRLSGGGKIQIIGDDPPEDVIGSEPKKVHCSDGGHKFKDLDGEGVAFDGTD